MSAAAPGRCFLVGCPRSGTTLLQHLLTTQAQVVSLPETHFVQRLLRSEDHRRQARAAGSPWRQLQQLRRRCQAGLGWVPRHQVQRAWQGIPELACPIDTRARWQPAKRQLQAFVAALDAYCARHGAGAWLEKTPDHLFYLAQIQRHVAGARVIHLVRDGAEVVASLHAAAHRYRPWRPFLDLDLAVDRWNRALQESLRWQGHPAHLLLRYEHVLQAPGPTLARLRAFLGLPGDPAAPRHPSHGLPLVRADEPWKRDATGPLRDHRKFEQMFTPRQQARIRTRLLPLPGALQHAAAV